MHKRFSYYSRAQATGADIDRTCASISKLMPYFLQVWIKTALGFDIGMADQIANLWLFATKITFSAHLSSRRLSPALSFVAEPFLYSRTYGNIPCFDKIQGLRTL